jgi:TRAP-type C4-dicarboxylate transport system permease small subunit
MNTKKILKVVTVLAIIAMICSFAVNVFAVSSIPTGTSTTTSGKVNGLVGKVIGVVQVICFAAAVIMLMFLGVKYVTASPDGKAEIKKSAVQYIVGAVVLFAAGGILGIVQGFANEVS